MKYESRWWSLELPSGWFGYADGPCSTFTNAAHDGVLQVSAAYKDIGQVTDDDLKEFASERISSHSPLDVVISEGFSGITIRYQREGRWWQEWWLRSDHLMVYLTYNASVMSENTEHDAISSIISSLKAQTS